MESWDKGLFNLDYITDHFNVHNEFLMKEAKERVDKAKILFSRGFLVKEVAEKLHYSSYMCLYKIFKRRTGLTPTQYKKYSHNPR